MYLPYRTFIKKFLCTLHKQAPLKNGDICLLKDQNLIRKNRLSHVKVIAITKSRVGNEARAVKLEVIPCPLNKKNLNKKPEKYKYIQLDARIDAKLEIFPVDDNAHS